MIFWRSGGHFTSCLLTVFCGLLFSCRWSVMMSTPQMTKMMTKRYVVWKSNCSKRDKRKSKDVTWRRPQLSAMKRHIQPLQSQVQQRLHHVSDRKYVGEKERLGILLKLLPCRWGPLLPKQLSVVTWDWLRGLTVRMRTLNSHNNGWCQCFFTRRMS